MKRRVMKEEGKKKWYKKWNEREKSGKKKREDGGSKQLKEVADSLEKKKS